MQKPRLKNILHLPRWYPNISDPQNGVFVEKQIKLLSDRFNNYVLFVKSENINEPYQIEESEKEGLTVITVYFKKKGNPLLNLFGYFSGFKKGLRRVLEKIERPDMIHVHILLRTGLLGWYYARKFGVPYIVSEHWSGYITGAFEKKNILYRKLMLFVLNNASKVMVVSRSLKTELVQKGIPEDKIEIIPNVVESRDEPSERNDGEGKIVMLSVADLVDDIKKISEVIEVLPELELRHDLEYHIIGDGPDRETLEKLAEDKGLLNTSVFFHGRKTNEEVLREIHDCSFLVMNSVVETFSVVTAEALMAGKPVVVTRCGGPEYFVNKSNGILVKPGNRAELREALDKMTATFREYDPERLKQSVDSKFSKTKIALQLTKVYDKILSGK
jgi:glycosyltransferase involved in cell wall biosynthesis